MTSCNKEKFDQPYWSRYNSFSTGIKGLSTKLSNVDYHPSMFQSLIQPYYNYSMFDMKVFGFDMGHSRPTN